MTGSRPKRDELSGAAEASLSSGVSNLARLQTDAGSWKGDYGGPMFLLPMYVALMRIAGRSIPGQRRSRMTEYIFNSLNPDGSIGLHSEGSGHMFTTALCYVALRYLGVDRGEPRLAAMRSWIGANGTALGAASWGKFTLAFLNLYEYDGLNPVLPELWLLPPSSPIHPGRLWCHARVVYLPMSWLYGTRSRIPEDDMCHELRGDLYDRRYGDIPFREHCQTIAGTDNYRPTTALLRSANRIMHAYEKVHSKALRRRALETVARHIDYEDQTTDHVNLGPVNAILNRVCHHFRDPGGDALMRGWDALDEYVWNGHDGTRFNGYQSTELWDTAFAMQAITRSPASAGNRAVLERGYGFVRDNQIEEDTPDHEAFFRHESKGGWPFSTKRHGWPISDCTAEGLKVAMECAPMAGEPVTEQRMKDAVALILSLQNRDGGWASYERCRGPAWLEQLNPSQVFGDIMVEASFPECSSSCIQALAGFRKRFPGHMDAAIDGSIERGVAFLRETQRPDGSWEGSWGVCFTYGTWFGVSGLVAAGVPVHDPAIRGAVRFLLTRQMPDGGWGEHHRSCSERRPVALTDGHVVMTSWALLTLVRAHCEDAASIRRAVRFLIDRQDEEGGWPRQTMAGVFNRTCLINYDNYRHYFPVWALAEWRASITGSDS